MKTMCTAKPRTPRTQTPQIPAIPTDNWADRAHRRAIQWHANALCRIPEEVSERWKKTLNRKMKQASEGRGLLTPAVARALFILINVAPAKAFGEKMERYAQTAQTAAA